MEHLVTSSRPYCPKGCKKSIVKRLLEKISYCNRVQVMLALPERKAKELGYK